MYKKTEGLTWEKAKAKWVRDLRSGKFKQGRGRLLTAPGNFCCLGVLATQVVDIRRRDSRETLRDATMLIAAMKLPQPIKNALSKMSGYHTTENELIHFNDSKRWSFAKIADWIEENM